MGAITGLLGVGGGSSGSGYGGPSVHPQDYTGNANLQTTFQGLQNIANGNGPNPAQAQYFQNVQDLAKQQAGAIGSVQGISPALAARMISQQGSGAMQNAAAAGASNLAAQQLGAYGQMGSIAGSQANIAAGLQQNVNNVNAGLANTQMQGQQGFIGGLMNTGASAAGFMKAQGGMVGHYAGGGDVGPQSIVGRYFLNPAAVAQFTPAAPVFTPGVSGFAQGLGGQRGTPVRNVSQPAADQPVGKSPIGDYAPGGSQIYQSPNFGSSLMNMSGGMGASNYMGSNVDYANSLMGQPTGMAQGGRAQDYRSGGGVAAKSPGQKAKVPGNSYANDKIPAMLSEGEVVIPRNVMQSKNPPEAAARFVQAVMAKRGKK